MEAILKGNFWYYDNLFIWHYNGLLQLQYVPNIPGPDIQKRTFNGNPKTLASQVLTFVICSDHTRLKILMPI